MDNKKDLKDRLFYWDDKNTFIRDDVMDAMMRSDDIQSMMKLMVSARKGEITIDEAEADLLKFIEKVKC